MKFLLVLAAFLALAAAAPHLRKPTGIHWSKLQDRRVLYPHLMRPTLKKAPRFPGKIVGGEETEVNEFPHQVALEIDGMYFCGGSIINAGKTILTAAHCMDGAATVRITVGDHHRGETEDTEVTHVSNDFTVHENWISIIISNDIALIHLSVPIDLHEHVAEVTLCTADANDDPQPGDMVTASGWGRPSDADGSISPVLRKVTVPVLDNGPCADYYGALYVTDRTICIDSTGGVGTCNGDSGGPLTTGDKETGYTTWGITSFGASAGCEAGFPDAFTRCSAFRLWIDENVQ